MTRRGLISLVPGAAAFAQGIASRGVKPAPRGKPSGKPFPVRFTDIAKAAGLTAPSIYGPEDRKDYILEAVGCGVAMFDYDNDGWLDLLILSGTRFDGSAKGASNRLYKNNRDGTFTDVTEKAGLLRSGWASGVAIGDYNNDGFEDIFISYWGENVLYRNNGNGTFTDVTREAGLIQPERHWNSGCTFVDFDRDGHLDLFVCSYLEFDPARVPKPGATSNCTWKGVPVNCGPRGLPRGRCFLYRNDGKGRFMDVTRAAGVGQARAYCLTAIAADLDNDGWPDLYVACDSTSSLLFRNKHDGTFAEEALERGIAVNDDGMEQAGMGIAVGDFEPDGNLDLFKTHFSDDTSILYRNDGKGNFSDVTLRSGIAVETRFVGWGAGFADFDNDGLPDILLVTGSVYPEIEAKVPAYPFKTPRVLFRNLGEGRFEELFDSAISEAHSSRGCAFGDFDNDGDVDVLVWNMNEPPTLLRNDCTSGGKWLKVALHGRSSNRSAIGSRVTVRFGTSVHAQEVLSQSSFLSCSDRRLHFGLGGYESADVTVNWPSGKRQVLRSLKANHLHLIDEDSGLLKSVEFPNS